jgi:conjugal transfer pilus assembly protein TraV
MEEYMYTQTPTTAFAPLLGLAFCFSLCACSTTSETFDCPAGKGVGCKSVTEINQMIDQGALSGVPVAAEKINSTQAPPSLAFANTPLSDSRVSDLKVSDEISVQRIQEEHLRVWIAPYQDAQGNLHEGSIVHTVLKPGSWQVRVADPKVSDSSVADPSAVDPSISDASISDANIDDPGVTESQSSESEEYS